MADLEDKLNALLSDPDSMAQVVQMAQQLSAAMGSDAPSSPPPETDGAEAQLLRQFLPLIREYKNTDSRTMQLLMALRPFLRPEKQEKVAQAVRLSHMIHVGKRLLLEREDGHV